MKHHLLRFARITIILCAGILFMQTAVSAIAYQHTIKLKKMTFSWSLKGDKLYVKLVAPTRGWVGIGFNPTQRMQDANYVLGYVKNGKVQIADAFGVRPKEHIHDTSMKGRNDVTDVSGSEKGKTTAIEFAVPLDSGDPADVSLSRNEYTTVLLAFGKGRDNFHGRHRYRTSLKVNLSTGKWEK